MTIYDVYIWDIGGVIFITNLIYHWIRSDKVVLKRKYQAF